MRTILCAALAGLFLWSAVSAEREPISARAALRASVERDAQSCYGYCASEQGQCVGSCGGNGQCVGQCASAYGRCVAQCR